MAYRLEQAPVYQAVQDFARLCLIGDKSLLWPDQEAWTPTNVAEVKRRIVDTPLFGEGSYEEKLLQQMQGASASQWIILCDTFYIYYLPSSSITLRLKRERLDWLRTQGGLPAPAQAVWEAQSHGFTRTSQRYNLKYAQTWLILLLASHVKQQTDRSVLLSGRCRFTAATTRRARLPVNSKTAGAAG